MNDLPWGQVRSFLVAARQGSLSAAARELGMSQPTLSRDIQALEAATGLNLFRRTNQGLVLTEPGQALMEAAQQMGGAAERFARQAAGLSVDLEGEVRISANEIVGTYLLPPAIADFRRDHPAVELEVVISNRASSLSKREADIALRMFRPTQPELVARRLAELELGFYVHRDYLDRHGEPADLETLKRHTLVGFDEGTEFIDAAARLGYPFERDDFALRTDSLLAQVALLRAGAGIGVTHAGIASRWPELVRILDDVALPALQLWCVTHRDLQYNARVRAVVQHLSEWFEGDPYHRVLI